MKSKKTALAVIATPLFGASIQQARPADQVPIVKRFIGQPIENLLRWCRHIGGLQHVKWKE